MAVGTGATATGANSAALGNNSSASADNSVALGVGSTASRGAQPSYKDPISGKPASSVGEVSVGSPGAERQITNVAPGTAPTDAANVAQVQAAIGQRQCLYRQHVRQGGAADMERGGSLSGSRQHAPGMDPGTVHGRHGAGHFTWRGGMAVGGSYYMPDNSVIMKASASYGGPGRSQRRHGDGFRPQLKRCACLLAAALQPLRFKRGLLCHHAVVDRRHGSGAGGSPMRFQMISDADVNKNIRRLMA